MSGGREMRSGASARAYYNEIDPAAAHVLRCLIADGLIAPGDVDDRSIKDISPDDLAGYTQCHFFAGAGLWSVAARLAGWPDDRPLWTGSCPCQPFSAAGRGLGTDDPRHLWPDFFRLIRACRPPVVMGEQVAGSPGYGWFDGVRADLAGEGFASRVVDIPACAVDAPHIRQRLYWLAVECDPGPHGYLEYDCLRIGSGPVTWPSPVAHGSSIDRRPGLRFRDEARHRIGQPANRHREIIMGDAERRGRDGTRLPDGAGQEVPELAGADGREAVRAEGAMVHPTGLGRREGRAEHELRSGRTTVAVADASGVTLGDAFGSGLEGQRRHGDDRPEPGRVVALPYRPASAPDGRNGSAWSGAEWLTCHDGKARRTEPGLRLLVDGMAGRVPAWRLAGNSISPVLAAEVIGAYLDAERTAA